MTSVIKLLGAQIDISTTANSCSNNKLIMIVNTDNQTNVLDMQYANGVTYANCSINHDSTIIVEKWNADDLVIGTGLYAVPVAYRN